MRRPLYYLTLVSFAAFVDCRSHHLRQELVHTFDTRDSCTSRCTTTCTQVHSEDLMMPRWQCPQENGAGTTVEEEDENTIEDNLIFIIPAAIIGSLVFLFCFISCLQRFCRNYD